MRVNAALKGLFNDRWVLKPRIVVVLFAIVLTSSSFTENPGRDLRAKEVNLLIRQTGHQLLLQSGDSTSRVLPVTEMKEGTFLLRFEKELVFNHDSLIALSQRLLPKNQFPSGYTVTVHDCAKGSIVYGFQVNNLSPDILACTGRSQPAGCYTIEFAFPDFYAEVKQQKAKLNGSAQSAEMENQNVTGSQNSISNGAISSQDNKAKFVEANPTKVDPDLTELKSESFDFPFVNVIFGIIVVSLGGTLLIAHFRRNSNSGSNQNQTISKESVSDSAALGSFLFNVKAQQLLLGSEIITLTDKECKVLTLLHKNFGELIPRETLMQEVWINEGVITGRSLDMFVSKLRKKLSSDPALRITNVHGKGYKLEIPEQQVV